MDYREKYEKYVIYEMHKYIQGIGSFEQYAKDLDAKRKFDDGDLIIAKTGHSNIRFIVLLKAVGPGSKIYILTCENPSITAPLAGTTIEIQNYLDADFISWEVLNRTLEGWERRALE